MSGEFSKGWSRLGRVILGALQTLVSVEDAPEGPRLRKAASLNLATGMPFAGSVGGVDTSGHTAINGALLPRTQKR